MAYPAAVTAPKRFQFEANASPSQPENCGPTCITQMAGFYKNTPTYQIETTRNLIKGLGPYNVNGNLVYGAPPRTPTNAWQQRDMLARRGIAATVRQINSLAELHSIVDSGRRPVLVGIQMSRVAFAVKDHNFNGWHAVLVLDDAYVGGRRGFWVTDPNFSPAGGIRPDPDRGMKFYSDSVMQYAFIQNVPRWSVIPNTAKPVTAPATTTSTGRGRIAGPDCNIRTSMSLTANNVYARSNKNGFTYRVRDGAKLWSNLSNYVFHGWGGTNQDWAICNTGSGMRLYISRAVFVVTRKP